MSKDIHRPVLAVAVITAFITTFTGSALNLSIPDIGAEFNVSAEAVGWLITGYTLSVAAFSVPFGRMADMTERRKILITGIAVFSVCCAAAFFFGFSVYDNGSEDDTGHWRCDDFQYEYSGPHKVRFLRKTEARS